MIRLALLLHETLPQWKVYLASLAAFVSVLANAVPEGLPPWAEKSWPLLLVGAIVWMAKLLVQMNSEHRKEIAATWAEHKRDVEEREERLVTAMEASAKAQRELATLTEAQTNYFKTVTRNIVDQRLRDLNVQLPEG